MNIFLKKQGNSLVPANKDSEEALEELKEGQWYKGKITKPRNVAFHRKFFALLNTVVEQSDFYTGKGRNISIEELKERVKFNTGHYDIIAEIDGVKIIKTRSISFDKMDNIQFEDFYNSAMVGIIGDSELGITDLEGF